MTRLNRVATLVKPRRSLRRARTSGKAWAKLEEVAGESLNKFLG